MATLTIRKTCGSEVIYRQITCQVPLDIYNEIQNMGINRSEVIREALRKVVQEKKGEHSSPALVGNRA